MATADALLSDRSYLAYRLNFDAEQVEFLPVHRDDIKRVSCLRKEDIDPNRSLEPVPLKSVLPYIEQAPQQIAKKPPKFIFHTAFCASTFLSRCMDVDDASLCLREPQLMLDAANAKRIQWRSRTTSLDYRHLPTLAIRLLQKHALDNEQLVLKPINTVNNIVPELLQASPGSKAIMLYTDAKSFLLSTLKEGETGKHLVRAMFDLVRCDFQHLANVRLTDFLSMTDIDVTLTLWRLHIQQAEQWLSHFAPRNLMRSLYGEKLVSHPLQALISVNQFLGTGLAYGQMESMMKDGRRVSDSKRAGQSFSIEKRAETYRKLEAFYGEDIENSIRWMTSNNPDVKISPQLSGALDV